MSTFMRAPNSGSRGNAQWGPATPAQRRGKIKRRFIAGLIFIPLLATLLTCLMFSIQSEIESNLDTVSGQNMPASDSTQNIVNDLEAIDNWATDFLTATSLPNPQNCTLMGRTSQTATLTFQECDAQNIDEETIVLNQDLFAAEHNATYAGQQTLLERVSIGVQSYLTDLHQMRADYALASQKNDLTDSHVQQAYQDYRSASDILNQQVVLPALSSSAPAANLNASSLPFDREVTLPDCSTLDQLVPTGQTQSTHFGLLSTLDCLSVINQTNLANTYTATSQVFDSSSGEVFFLLTCFCCLLSVYVISMVRSTHRLLNAGLLLGTLTSIIISLATWNALWVFPGSATIQIITTDSTNISTAAQLRTAIMDARANESRLLLSNTFNSTSDSTTWDLNWQYDSMQINKLAGQMGTATGMGADLTGDLVQLANEWTTYQRLDAEMRARKNLSDAEQDKIKLNTTFNDLNTIIQRIEQTARYFYNQDLVAAQNTFTLYQTLDLIFFPLAALLAMWGIGRNLKHF